MRLLTFSGQAPDLYVYLDDLPGNAIKAAEQQHPMGAPCLVGSVELNPGTMEGCI